MEIRLVVSSIDKVYNTKTKAPIGGSNSNGKEWFMVKVNNEFTTMDFVLREANVVIGSDVVINYEEVKNGQFVNKKIQNIYIAGTIQEPEMSLEEELALTFKDIYKKIKELEDAVYNIKKAPANFHGDESLVEPEKVKQEVDTENLPF